MARSRYNVAVKGKNMQGDSEQPSGGAWRQFYLAALFELDLAKLAERIAEAEYAVSLRARELCYLDGDHNSEKQALTGAMRALDTLRDIHQCPRPAPSPCSTAEGGSGVH
jgi:hypothetical protein